MTDTTNPDPTEQPKRYTDEVAPMPHWPVEPARTCRRAGRRTLDPELINSQVADEVAERPEPDLAAERAAAFERVKALGWVDLNHIDEIVTAVLGVTG